MLNKARKIFISELMLVRGINEKEAIDLLDHVSDGEWGA
jgi:RNA polymerase-interacting CarD/CdnL/TRCF family regulator